MSFNRIYRGTFTNTQVQYSGNPSNPNEGNEQDCYITIYDTNTEGFGDYGVWFRAQYNPSGTYITVNFTVNYDTSNTSQIELWVSDDGGATYSSYATYVSPVAGEVYTATQAPGDYLYFLKFILIAPPDEEIVFIEEDEEIELELAETPALIEVVDNDEDKYTPIRSKQLQIQIHSTSEVDISNFSGTDNQFYVEFAVGAIDRVVFSGFLSVSDLRQPFQAPPAVITLTATDGLGFLKDIPLVDYNGDEFTNENKIIEYIGGALRQTGLNLQILTEMNIREVDYSADADGHFYNTIYLDAKTFEQKIGEFVSCYDALKYILGEMCELSQEKNRWYIRRIHEIEGDTSHPRLQALYGPDGSFLENITSDLTEKQIGADMTLYDLGFMNDDAEVFKVRGYKSVKHTFNFTLPDELPCNVDFSRGELIGDDGTETVDDITYTRKKYELDCWGKYWSSITGDQAATIDIEVKKLYDDYDYERSRYVNIPQETTGKFHFIMSDGIPVHEGDKMNINLSMSLSGNVSGSGGYSDQVLQVRLYADDGTFWTHHGKTSAPDEYPFWRQCLTEFEIDDLDLEWYVVEGNLSDDQRLENGLYDGETASFPKDGVIKICVFQSNLYRADHDTHIHKVDFEYIPKIGGTFKKFSGQYHLSEQDTDDKAVRDQVVYISDSPKKIFKGALLKFNGIAYVLTNEFYDHWVFPSGPPSDEYTHPYGQIQNQDVWNQYNREFVGFEGTIDGLDTDKYDSNWMTEVPGFIHSYTIKDANENTNNKVFKLIRCQQDFNLCEFELMLLEVFDRTIAKNYLGHSFNYIKND